MGWAFTSQRANICLCQQAEQNKKGKGADLNLRNTLVISMQSKSNYIIYNKNACPHKLLDT